MTFHEDASILVLEKLLSFIFAHRLISVLVQLGLLFGYINYVMYEANSLCCNIMLP